MSQEEILKRYWLTPPDIYYQLDSEFHFDFDPCKYPMMDDGLLTNWGKMNYVNPPFRSKDGSPTAFVRKAIEESKKGNSSVLMLPTQSYVNLMLQAGAELRPMGRIRWLEVITKKPMPSPSNITLFYLKGQQTTKDREGIT